MITRKTPALQTRASVEEKETFGTSARTMIRIHDYREEVQLEAELST